MERLAVFTDRDAEPQGGLHLSKPSRSPKEVYRNPLLRGLATAFGAGLSPVMPGTVGSLVGAVPLLWILTLPHSTLLICSGVLLTTALCVGLSRVAERSDGAIDPGWFVLDEVAGILVAALACEGPHFSQVLQAFLWFRLFDITKPWPIRRLEKAGSGFGIVLDDLLAGGYAAAVLLLTNRFLPI